MSSMTGMMGSPSGKTGNVIPRGYQAGQISQFSPEQLSLFQQLFSQVGPESFLSKLAGGDQAQFEQMEAPALKQFNALQGNIASRFSGMGSGARRSSGFQNTLSQASQDFAGQLQSNRMNLQRQAIQDLMGMSGQLLGQRPYEQFLTEKPKSFLQQLLSGMSPGIGQGLTQFGGMAGLSKLGLSGV